MSRLERLQQMQRNTSMDVYREISMEQDVEFEGDGYLNFGLGQAAASGNATPRRKNSSDYFNRPSSRTKRSRRGHSKDLLGATSRRQRRCYYGPHVTCMRYRCMTPPPTWAQASRNLLMKDTDWKLHRSIELHLLPLFRSDNEILTESAVKNYATCVIRNVQRREDGSSSHISRAKNKVELLQPVSNVSVHAKVPCEGGVLELHSTGSGRNGVAPPQDEQETITEYTFTTAADAAQFQLDLLVLRFLGPPIFHMYEALAVCHQGSKAHSPHEPLLHHGTKTPQQESSAVAPGCGGIAWDDLMRCLSDSFPTIKLRLEALWSLQMTGSLPLAATTTTTTARTGKDTEGSSGPPSNVKPADQKPILSDGTGQPRARGVIVPETLSSDYANKRLLLGPVDFFRLFVPIVLDTAVPSSDCNNRLRMEQLLRWRKRIARASVLVQAYCEARVVSNRGWDLGCQLPQSYRWRRRMAHDDNAENMDSDAEARDQYYEATVSRDVVCQVRGEKYWTERLWWQKMIPAWCGGQQGNIGDKAPSNAFSAYQGYTLVGCHMFYWPWDDPTLPLHYTHDVVNCIPSLRKIVSASPDLEFFVNSVFLSSQQSIVVQVFVRSLAKGVDPHFDKNVRCCNITISLSCNTL